MATIIPSSRIFSIQNNKVVKNQINKIAFEETDVAKEEKELVNFSFSPFEEENGKLLWIKYLQYTSNWDFNQENIFANGNVYINGINNIGVGFRIRSENYIDLKSISIKLSMQYRRGESYSGNTASRPALSANENLQDISTAKATISFDEYSTTKETLVLSAYNNIPAAYARAMLNSSSKKSKSFVVTIFVPTYYNPQFTEQTGRIDSVVFPSFSVSIIGKEYDLSSTSKRTYGNGEKNFEIQSNEFFQSYQEGVDGENYPLGTFFESKDGNVSASENLCKKIIKNYKDGKETAVIRCSITENLSVFNIGYEVIPMVFGADGVDRPMSRYKDGADKVFVVVGTKFIYDGAVWQELTLQEKTQSV